ncbi:MAG: Protein-tyrosine-phosphatase [Herbinix sp.]|nr:Protein-tyrosine-phosphatase [Herbinix sp.]
MQGYFDIHCHILPGVDDGAKDMDETRRMLLIAYEEGIRIMVATPHFIVGNNNTEVESLKAIYEEVNQIAESSLKGFHIILGNELFYSAGIIEALRTGEALTIDGTRYILVEFEPGATFREIRDGLNHCIYSGYIPILAHVERYQCLKKDYELVGNLVKLGVYIQVNIYSILSRHNTTRKLCRKLLKKDWVHFLGTDSHGMYGRAPRAEEATTYLTRRYGQNKLRQLLWENPMTMLENKHL